MTTMKQNMIALLSGIVVVMAIVSAGYFVLHTQQPVTCTINQTPGNVMIIDKSMDNAVICTKVNESVVLQQSLWDRVNGRWYISNSTGLRVSDEVVTMFDHYDPGFGTIEWNITMISPGMQTLNATCKIVFGDGSQKILSTQNLTFVVR